MRRRRREPLPRTLLLGGVGLLAAGAALITRRRRRFELGGKTALVTGGSRGLGLVLARMLVQRGAKVAICARDPEELERARAELAAGGAEVAALVCDVTDQAAVRRMIAEAGAKLGPIEVLINNAGVLQVGPHEEMNLRDYQSAIDVYFWGPLYTCLEVVPGMKARGRGRIANISSIGGKIAVPHLVPYSAAKFALAGLSQGLGAELARHGIAVTSVFPGLMRTGSPIHVTLKGKHREEYTWFAISGALPLLSLSAEHAARRILAAIERGEAEVIIGPHFRLAAALAAIVPETFSSMLGLIARLLPGPGGTGGPGVLGKDSETPWTRSPLTALSRAAELRNNQR